MSMLLQDEPSEERQDPPEEVLKAKEKKSKVGLFFRESQERQIERQVRQVSPSKSSSGSDMPGFDETSSSILSEMRNISETVGEEVERSTSSWSTLSGTDLEGMLVGLTRRDKYYSTPFEISGASRRKIFVLESTPFGWTEYFKEFLDVDEE